MLEITEELLAWGNRTAKRYEIAYGDRDGRFLAEVGLALEVASRGFRRNSGRFPPEIDFRFYVMGQLRQRLNRVAKAKRKKQLPYAPVGDIHKFDVPVTLQSVGWELDYESLVRFLAGQVGGLSGEMLELVFLDCQGGSCERAATHLGISLVTAKGRLAEAMKKLRRLYSPTSRDVGDLFHDAS